MLLILIAFADFNPIQVMEGRKKEMLNNINDIAFSASSDSLKYSYYWKNGYDYYRIDVKKQDDLLYYIIHDSDNLWKINITEKKREKISFFNIYNLIFYDWILFLPDNYDWEITDKSKAILNFQKEGADIKMRINNEGLIEEVIIESDYGLIKIKYSDYKEITGGFKYPAGWVFESEKVKRKIKMENLHVNEGFCTPCTFKVPSF